MRKVLRLLFIAFPFYCCLLFSTASFAQVTHNESFDGLTFPPAGWQLFGGYSPSLFRVTSGSLPTQTNHSGAGELEWNSYSVVSGGMEFLATPMVSWSSRGASTPTVSFWFYRDVTAYNTSGYSTEGVNLSVSSPSLGQTQLGFVPRAGVVHTSGAYLTSGKDTTNSSGWFQYTFNIPVGYNTCANEILFQFVSQDGDNCFMDDVQYIAYPSVTDGPAIGLNKTCLNYGSLMVGGTLTDSVMISNNGCDTLKVSGIVATPGVFTVSPPTSLTILPGQQPTYVKVKFAPVAAISYTGTVTFHSNVHDTTICLSGTGLPAPTLSVTPTALTATLSCCDSTTLPLTIHNTGASNLICSIKGIGMGLKGDTSILVIEDNPEWGVDMQNFIQTHFGKTPTKITSSQIAATNFLLYDIVITMGQQSSTYYNNVSANKTKFEAFANSGGIVQYQLGNYSGTTVNLVGGVNDPSGNNETYNTVVLPTHPIVNGLPPTLAGNDVSAGYLTNLPGNAVTIIRTQTSAVPTTIEYTYGNGIVIASTLTLGYLYSNCASYPSSCPVLQRICAYSMSKIGTTSKWISLTPKADTTAAGGSSIVNVKFKSCGLVAKTYTTNVTIASNDPAHPSVSVPCTLTVAGSPKIVLNKTCINYGSVMVGAHKSDSVQISNTGCDTLHALSITGSPSVFVSSPTSGNLPPGQSGYVKVTFNPTAVSTYTGTLTFHNSNAHDTTICLTGTGIPTPSITVTPTALTATLSCCDSTILPLTIHNAGGSNLICQVGGNQNFSEGFESGLTQWVKQAGSSWTVVPDPHSGSFSLKESPTGNYFNSMNEYIQFAQKLKVSDKINCSLSFWEKGQFETCCDNYTVQGSINGGPFNTFITLNGNFHGWTQHVFSLTPYVNNGDSVLLRFNFTSDGSVVYSGINMDDISVTGINSFPLWLKNTSASLDTIAPGNSTIANLKFKSCGLVAGTYTYNVSITSNDPVNNPLFVPVTMHVVGSPKIVFNKTCINYGSMFVGASAKDSVLITNTGCDTLRVLSIIASPGVFTVSPPTSGKIPPSQFGYVKVTFVPSAASTYTGTLTFHSSNANDTTICLTGTGIPAPTITVNPLSFHDTLACVDSTTKILTINNIPGGNNLTYSINILNPTMSSSLPIAASCSPPGTQNTCCNMGIVNVTLNSINNTTSISDGEYHDYTASQKTILVPGQTYTFSVQSGNSYNEYAEAWIDYNNNGTFESGENVMNNLNTLPNTIHTATFTVPFSAAKNKSVRMRVVSDYSSDGIPQPCTNVYYGQFEDYTIQIPGWVMLSSNTGTVTTGSSNTVAVTFNSKGLSVGTYSATISISNNDPIHNPLTVPTTLTVVGAGKIAVSKTCMYLDSIMQYTSHTDSLYIKNTGCDTLRITNITKNTGIFSVNSTTFKIATGDSAKLKVTFSPITYPGPFIDTLYIHNNDITNPIKKICLSGKSFQRPIISTVPTSLSYTLACCDSTTLPLTIHNTGGSNLINQITGGSRKIKIALVNADPSYVSDVQTKLVGTGKFTAVDIINATVSTPSLAQLKLYDALLVWSNSPFNNTTTLGNNLADYVDAGGGVVVAVFADASQPISGRFGTGNAYYCINPSGQTNNTVSLGTIFVPNHPILKGVTSLSGSNIYHQSSTAINAGATRIANWSDGTALIATRVINGTNRVDLGMFPPSNDVIGGGWLPSTNGAILMANALFYSANASVSWLAITPQADTIAPSGSAIVNVKFKSCGLTVGTYTANITIASNDPLKPSDTIPATLHVIGAPKIVFNKTCVNFGSQFVNSATIDSVMVTNTGCDTLRASSIVATPSIFTVSPASGNLPPGQSGYVKVTFTPTALTSYTGTVTFHSNIPDTTVCLTGTGIPPPVQCHSPNSFNVHFTICQDSITDTLSVCNTIGGSNLNYNLWSPYGRSASFNGSGAYIYNNAPNLPTGSVMTAEAWIYPVSYPNATWNPIVSWGSSSTASNMMLFIQNTGRPSMSIWGYNFIPGTGPTATLNQWNHIACVLNGTSVTLYMNGVPISGTVGIMPTVQSSNLYIGYTNFSASYFSGKIDEVRIYNRALSQSEILANMTNSLAGNESGLKGYWNFDNGTANDLTANGNNGTLVTTTITVPNAQFIPSATGTITPTNTYSVQVKFKKVGLPFGTHTIPLYLNSNDPSNPSDTISVSMTIDSVPPTAPIAGSNSPICTGNNLSLTASTIAGATYAWSGPNSFTSSLQNPSVISVTTAASGTYSVTATKNGCTSTAGTVTVTVNPPPGIPTAGSNSTVCSGLTLSLTASTVTGATYSWSGPNSFSSASQNPTITNVTTLGNGTYSVTATLGGCPPSTAGTTTVTIHQTPASPAAGSNSPICAGSNLSLTASTISGVTYSWTGPNSFSSSSQNPTIVSATTAGTGTYSVSATANGCISTAGTTTATVNPPPSAPTAGSNSTVCSGQTLSLTASTISGATYSWNGPNSFSSALQNPTITNVTTAASGTYSVTATVGGCPTSAAGTTTVTIHQTPVAPTASSNSPVCAGNNLSLTASTIIGATYLWSTGSTTQNPIIISVTTAYTGTYSVVASVGGCTGPAGTTTVVINSPPSAPVTSSNSPVCVGSTLSLTAGTIVGAAYSWTGPNSFSSAAQNPVIPGVTTAGSGTYSVTATVGGCSGTAGTTTVTVNPPPSVPIVGSNSTVCSGNTLSLTASTVSGATYSWTGPNSFSSASQNPTIAGVTTAGNGTYSVTAIVGGCPPSSAGTTVVTIHQTPSAPIAGSNSPVCAGNNLSLTANTIAGAAYSWTGPNSFSSSSQNPVIIGVSPLGTGTYSVDVTIGGCTGPIGTTTVTVNPPPSAPTAGSNSTVCSGQILSLTASTISGAVYSWSGPNSFSSALQNPTIVNVTTAASGTYSVTVLVGGCPMSAAGTTSVTINQTPVAPIASSNSPVCVGSDLSLTASTISGVTYSWTGPNSFSSSSQYPVIVSATTAASGTYSVTASAGGCTGPAGTTTVIINPSPSAPIVGSNSTVCSGLTLSLTASTISGATYSWTGPNSFLASSQNPTITNVTTNAAGTYSVTATVGGCPTSAAGTGSVAINQTPAAPITGSNSPVCSGNTLSLTANNITGATYSWNGPNSFSSASQNPTIAGVTTAGNGTYSVTATVSGCSSSAGTTTVIINQTPAAPIAGSNSPVCAGQTLSLTASTISGATYAWTGPNSFSSAIQNPIIVSVPTTNAGTYSVTATANGCTGAVGTTSVIVNPVPSTPIGLSNSPVCSGQTLSLTTNLVGGATYSWTGPNSFTSSFQNPTIANVTTAGSGTYSLTVTVSACASSVGTTPSVTINQTPSAPIAGSNSPVCTGTTLSLTASTISGVTYSWTGPNSFSDGTQNPTIASVTTTNAGTYSVTASANGCTGTAGTTTVSVNPPPATPTAGSNSTVCSGQTLSLTASTVLGATYSWNGPNSFSSTSQNPTIANVTTNAAGTYSVSAILGGCPPSIPGTVLVAINQTPAAPTVGSNSPVCVGFTLSLTASASGTTYSWNGPNSFSSVSQNPTISGVTLANAGTYSVTATTLGCTGPAGTTSVTINPIPVQPTAANQSGCFGNAIPDLTATGTNIEWYDVSMIPLFSGNPYATGQTAVGTYTYNASQTVNGCTSPATTVTLTINPLPVTPVASHDTAICYGNPTPALTSTGINIKWYNSSMVLVGSGSPFATGQTAPGIYKYYVTQTNTVTTCESLRDSVTLTINSIAPPIAPDVAVCAGNPVPDLTAIGTDIQWYDNLGNLVHSGSPFATTQTVVGTYTYYVTQTNTVTTCSSVKDTVYLFISTPPTLAPTVPDQNACFGTAIPNLVATSGTIINWYSNASLTNLVHTGNPFATGLTAAGSYTFFAADSTPGCPHGPSDTAMLVINVLPATLHAHDTASCFGSPTPTLIAIGTNVEWYNSSMAPVFSGDTLVTGQTAAATYTYYVTQTNTVTTCSSKADTVHLTIHALPSKPVALDTTVCSAATIPNLTSSGINVQWYDTSGAHVFTGNSFATGQTTPGLHTYYVTQKDAITGCESVRDTATLVILLSPPVPVANNVAVCFGNPVPSLTSTGTLVKWYSNASLTNIVHTGNTFNTGHTTVGVYTYWVTDSLTGCVSISADSATLTINAAPAKPVANNITICRGGSSVMTSTGNNPQWYSDATLINMIGTGNNFSTGETAVGMYTYYVTDFAAGCGNSLSDTAILTIHPAPLVTANTYSVTIVQNNSTVLISYNAVTYLWSTGATTNSIIASPTVTTTYTVTGTNEFGCSNSVTILVVVNPLGVILLSDPVQDVNVYPNPAIDRFTLEFNTLLESPMEIDLINTLGEKINVIQDAGMAGTGLKQHKYTVSTGSLAEGVYHIQIVTEQGTVNRRVVLLR